MGMKNSWQVATAAEALVAAQFARCGWDISVQYGANQPEYDLVAVSGDKFLKISVKGSKDGAWGLTQSYLAKDAANYQEAIEGWLARYTRKTVFCFVQFKDTEINEMPRLYLATPQEVAAWLKSAISGRGSTVLYEKKAWTSRAHGAGTTDEIPASWCFTEARIEQLVASFGAV